MVSTYIANPTNTFVHLHPSLPYFQVVLIRHSLYALAGRDVMVASFASVSVVTVGMMTAMVVGVIALMLAGITQVGEENENTWYTICFWTDAHILLRVFGVYIFFLGPLFSKDVFA